MLNIIVDGIGRLLSSHRLRQPRLQWTGNRCQDLHTHTHTLYSDLSCMRYWRVAAYVRVMTSYLESSPLRRLMFWAVSEIWGSRLEGSPICGLCSYTPFIFSSASLREKRVIVWKRERSSRKPSLRRRKEWREGLEARSLSEGPCGTPVQFFQKGAWRGRRSGLCVKTFTHLFCTAVALCTEVLSRVTGTQQITVCGSISIETHLLSPKKREKKPYFK